MRPANERWRYTVTLSLIGWAHILCIRPANERWRYTVTPSLIGWAHTQNDSWMFCYLTISYLWGTHKNSSLVRANEKAGKVSRNTCVASAFLYSIWLDWRLHCLKIMNVSTKFDINILSGFYRNGRKPKSVTDKHTDKPTRIIAAPTPQPQPSHPHPTSPNPTPLPRTID